MPNSRRAKTRPDGTCTSCDLVHQGCAAHNQRGLPCGRRPNAGGHVCSSHGAATTAAKRKAAQARAQAKADAALAKAVVTLGLPIDISPTDALLGEVAATAGHVKWLLGQVRELAPADLVWGTTERRVTTGSDPADHDDDDEGPARSSGAGISTTQKAAPSIWYQLYCDERDRLVKVCAQALRNGIEERRLQLAKAQGEMLGQGFRAVLAAMFDVVVSVLRGQGVSDAAIIEALHQAWQAEMVVVIPREMRRLAEGDQ